MNSIEPSVTAPRKIFLLAVIAMVVIIDQVTKYLVTDTLQFGEVVQVIPGFFNLVLAYNKGVAFGVFSGVDHDGMRHLILAATTILALGAVYYFSKTEGFEGRVPQTALAMIVGGALGNLADRVRLGMVTDFLDFHVGEHHWPAFNIADSSICVAVFLLLFFTPAKKS